METDNKDGYSDSGIESHLLSGIPTWERDQKDHGLRPA
jgi:hypothetical protein